MTRIIRSKAEWHCLRVGSRGQEPSHAEKVATIISVKELKGYMLHLHHSGQLDSVATRAIQYRLSELETLYGRKLG